MVSDNEGPTKSDQPKSYGDFTFDMHKWFKKQTPDGGIVQFDT